MHILHGGMMVAAVGNPLGVEDSCLCADCSGESL